MGQWLGRLTWRQYAALCAVVAALPFAIVLLAPMANRNEGVAAWVEAFGVFVALWGGGELARQQFLSQEQMYDRRALGAYKAIIGECSRIVEQMRATPVTFADARVRTARDLGLIEMILGALEKAEISRFPDFYMTSRHMWIVRQLTTLLKDLERVIDAQTDWDDHLGLLCEFYRRHMDAFQDIIKNCAELEKEIVRQMSPLAPHEITALMMTRPDERWRETNLD